MLARGGDTEPPARLYSARRLIAAAALVVVLAAFGAWRLSFYRTQADVVRDQSLRDANAIQALRDATSRMRLVEAGHLIGQGARIDDGDQALGLLDDRITVLEHGFEHLHHAPSEMRVYADFKVSWSAYRTDAARALVLAREGRRDETARLYEGESFKAYAAASDALRLLAERNQTTIAALTASADAGYRDARFMTLMAFGLAGLLLLGGLVDLLRRRLSRGLD